LEHFWADQAWAGLINWASKRYEPYLFFLDEEETHSEAGNLSDAGADRKLTRRGRWSVAVVQKGGGRSGKGGGGVLGTHLFRACMHTRLGQPQLHEQAATPVSFRGRRSAGSA
jgi:hypothetical protein